MDEERKKALEAEAERYENRAKELKEEAELQQRIKSAKEAAKAAQQQKQAAAGGGLSLNFGGFGTMSRNTKIIVIIIGTLVIFALMKVMGC